MKRILILTTTLIMTHNISSAQTDADNFYRSDAVTAEKVSFPNQYKMKVGANLFRPKEMKPGEKRPAIIVGHPMGAVKEQAANLYAIKMAERGFVTLAIDLSFWGDSEESRATRSPGDIRRGFQRGGGFPRNAGVRRAQRHRRNRNLRQRKFRRKRGEDRSPAESRRHGEHVRHGRSQPQRTEKRPDT